MNRAVASAVLFLATGAFGAEEGWVLVPEGVVNGRQMRAFSMGRKEVTLGEYRGCVEAGACVPLDFAGCDPAYPLQEGAADKPVVCASWEQAVVFARWAGGRLPLESEWERAMALSMLGSASGPPLDLAGMHDGVWEWVQDSFSDSPAGPPRGGASRVVRGGDWHSCSRGARARIAVDASNRVAMLGFRLVRDLSPDSSAQPAAGSSAHEGSESVSAAP